MFQFDSIGMLVGYLLVNNVLKEYWFILLSLDALPCFFLNNLTSLLCYSWG